MSKRSSGLLKYLLNKEESVPVDKWNSTSLVGLSAAIGHLRELEECHQGWVIFSENKITLVHQAVSSLTDAESRELGLPSPTDLTFALDVEGTVGTSRFALNASWERNGVAEMTKKVGAFLDTTNGRVRIPEPLFSILALIDGYNGGPRMIDDQWSLLSQVRLLLGSRESEQEVVDDKRSLSAQVHMTAFLRDLKIYTASAFSLSLENGSDGIEFSPIPFSGEREPDEDKLASKPTLSDDLLKEFQGSGNKAFTSFDRAKRSYLLRDGSYLIMDPELVPALELVRLKQQAPRVEREEFAANPQKAIAEVYAYELESEGKLDGLDEREIAEVLEQATAHLFVETPEYADRAITLGLWEPPSLPYLASVPNDWMPEIFGLQIDGEYVQLSPAEVTELTDAVKRAIAAGDSAVEFKGSTIPATGDIVKKLGQLDALIKPKIKEQDKNKRKEKELQPGPYAVIVKENFEDLEWDPKIPPRKSSVGNDVTASLRTTLMQHQVEGFNWSLNAWKSGLPGILNADDQGLGKTLQTLGFMAWLVTHMNKCEADDRLPILIVAPTSLLRNWEAEADKHLKTDAIGSLVRAYGSSISGFRREGAGGTDTDDGEAKLNFEKLQLAITEGRGHKRWVLTTYETLANYHISFRDVEFSLVVFDEIQKLKNPKTMLNRAGRSVRARFRIGLTGTPIENRLSDLWTIMDVISPGKLGTLRGFSDFYGDATANNMENLYAQVFKKQAKFPAVGLRRMKDDVIEGLPRKDFRIHVRDMPERQATAYEAVRENLIGETSGVMLRTLHHIRSVSLHPEAPSLAANDELGYVNMSARLQSTISILEEISEANERVLIFIEDQKMQWFFAEYLRKYFNLEHVRIINGQTTVPRRMKYVKEFQKHLEDDQGFDLMILGPRAAGVGLTLTAAVHVIHLSRWWNPAVEDQCNDRIYRIGQKKDVTIHIPLAVHRLYKNQSFDCVLNDLMRRKRILSRSALWPATNSDGDKKALVGGMALENSFELGRIDSFDPVQFEHWILSEASKLDDWTALSTPVTGDAGADGVLRHTFRPDHGAIFQAKHTANTKNKTQVSAVEEVIKSSACYGIVNPQLFVITNASGFSAAAVKLAASNNVTLVDRNHLSLWPNHFLA